VSEAPTRIWAFHDGPLVGYFVGQNPGERPYVTEYIRADLVEAAIKRALEAKLAKAVEALDRIAGKAPYADDPYDIARSALAELKGDKP